MDEFDQAGGLGRRRYSGSYPTATCMPPPSRSEAKIAVKSLLKHLRAYDELRLRLQTRGGRLSDLARITEMLEEKVGVAGYAGEVHVSLSDPAGLTSALRDVGDGDVRLSIRQLETHMPVYYVCRTRRDWWAEYHLIVEDLYTSPGYPMVDDRFAKMMDSTGHEVYWLRLSSFRQAVESQLRGNEPPRRVEVDDILYDLGRYVFQSAWHEDQQVGLVTSRHFGLPMFRQAVELLYLALSGELCDVRAAIRPDVLEFFSSVYPQPAIRAFLDRLTGIEGVLLNSIPTVAMGQYEKLSRAFSSFIRTAVTWGARRQQAPLYRLIFANFTRLGGVARSLADDPVLRTAAGALEQEARTVIDKVIDIRSE